MPAPDAPKPPAGGGKEDLQHLRIIVAVPKKPTHDGGIYEVATALVGDPDTPPETRQRVLIGFDAVTLSLVVTSMDGHHATVPLAPLVLHVAAQAAGAAAPEGPAALVH